MWRVVVWCETLASFWTLCHSDTLRKLIRSLLLLLLYLYTHQLKPSFSLSFSLSPHYSSFCPSYYPSYYSSYYPSLSFPVFNSSSRILLFLFRSMKCLNYLFISSILFLSHLILSASLSHTDNWHDVHFVSAECAELSYHFNILPAELTSTLFSLLSPFSPTLSYPLLFCSVFFSFLNVA